MKSNKRVEWVDIGKFICIMCVMFSHLESNNEVANIFIKYFFLNVFFFLAGYVYVSPTTFKTHLTKKLKGLMIPWFVFGTFNIMLSSISSYKTDRNFMREMKINLLQVRGYGDRMWFVAALFVAFIPFYFIIKYLNKNQAIAVVAISLVIRMLYLNFMPENIFIWQTNALPWHIDYVPWSLLWMVLGYFFKTDWERIFDKGNKFLKAVILMSVYLVLVYTTILYLPGPIGEVLATYIRPLSGVMAIISLCKIIKTNKYFAFVGANTLTYLALHGKVEAVIEHVFKTKISAFYNMCLENAFYSTLLGIIITIAVSLILIIPTIIINKWLPWVLGRPYRKKATV
ncbi:acyltransferase family protein [Butyrivibrio sp. AC2005]|uniref:acyltransferase family protein n=1 Tax=Butyrivibrio sp. AC2005 TaxID=1280672 RepID=UPI000421E7DC|nr:acyltransferase family protein [Butyrivibrio sp. AC2005]